MSRYVEDDPFAKDSMYCYIVRAAVAQTRKRARIEEAKEDDVVVELSEEKSDSSESRPSEDELGKLEGEVLEDLEVAENEEENQKKKRMPPNWENLLYKKYWTLKVSSNF